MIGARAPLPTARRGPWRRRGAPAVAAVLLAALLLPWTAVPSITAAPAPTPHGVRPPDGSSVPTPMLGPFPLVNGTHVNVAALMPYYIARQTALEAGGTSHAGLPKAAAPRADPAPDPSPPPPWSGPSGTVSGTVVDSANGTPIDGATVQLSELTSSCGGVCNQTGTGANGVFTVSGPSGPGILEVSAANYLENDTLVTVPAGGTTNVGSIALEHDAYLVGTLRADDPSHEPVGGVSVTSSSRNYAVIGGNTTSAANGSFEVEVPPVPDVLTFSPGAGPGVPYLGNQTFADPVPGAVVDLGVIFLPRGTRLNVHLIDAESGSPISGARPSIQACEADSQLCPYLLSADNGSIWAIPGPTKLHTVVLGYVMNNTDLGVVPPEPQGTVLNVTVPLVPDAVIVFSTNLSGGPPPPQAWNDTAGAVQFCSLDSLFTGFLNNVSSGVSQSLCSPILRSDLYKDFRPGQVLLAPPLRTEMHFYSHFAIGNAGYALPAYSNDTFLNTTPGEVLDLGVVNLTPGGWVQGRVIVAGTGAGPTGAWSVSTCSTDSAVCAEPAPGGIDCAGSTADPAAFCASTPPGPFELTVQGEGIASNVTWGESAFACCNHLGQRTPGVNLSGLNRQHLGVINVTPLANSSIYGTVVRQVPGGTVPASGAGLEICPVASDPAAGAGCYSSFANSSGGFELTVSPGWYVVNAALTTAGQNRTWVDAVARNDTGTIVLTPLAFVYGVAVTPSGTPVAGATVDVCPAAYPSSCEFLGAGYSGTGGLFFGSHPGGPFPGGAYRFDVSEPGYTDGSAWANLSSGSVVFLGRVVLVPTGNLPLFRGASVLAPTGSGSSWVDGFVVDGTSGQALVSYSVAACPLLGSAGCATFANSPTTDGGEFNGSIPDGPTWVNISAPGYDPLSVYANLSGAPTHLGILSLRPFPTLAGRVLFGPWVNQTLAEGLGPASVTVSVCNGLTGVCGISDTPDSGGFFNISAPVGSSDELTITPVPAATRDYSVTAGSGSYSTLVGVPANGTVLNMTPSRDPVLTLYAGLVGRVGDQSTWDPATQVSVAPVRYGVVTLSYGGTVLDSGNTTGGGMYTLFAPPGAKVDISASGTAYRKVAVTTTAAPDSGIHPVGDLNAPHYGWVELHVVASSGGHPIGDAAVVATLADPANRTTVSSAGLADASGFVNLSAPAGTLTVNASYPGFVHRGESVTVGESTTTTAPTLALNGSPEGIWVTSETVTTYRTPPTVTVEDPLSHAPLQGATVGLYDATGLPTGPTTTTNGLGQFLLAGPPTPGGMFAVQLPGYGANGSVLPAPSGVFRFATIGLEGDGVVSGEVLEAVSGAPLGQTVVTACSSSGATVCQSTTTNASGAYWLALPPGYLDLTFSAPGYVANQSIVERLCSDCFLVVPGISLWRASLIVGTLIGTPTGDPLPQGQVTLCEPGQPYLAYCAFPIPMDPLGGFSLEVGAGTYLLNATAPGYNEVSFELSTGPGELVALGPIALAANGSLAGTVLGSTTGRPLPNVTALACPVGGSAPCNSSATGPAGAYAVSLAPGLCTLALSATGYEPMELTQFVGSGERLPVPTVTLQYLGLGGSFPVAGAVDSGGHPIPAAIVTAYAGSAEVASTATGSQGTYALSLPWGSYSFVLTAGGYAALTVPVTVHGPVSGLRSTLLPFAWPVVGTVLDSYAHRPVPDLALELHGDLLGRSGSSGNFSFALPNGTDTISLLPGPGAPAAFLPSTDTVTVAGGPTRTDPVVTVWTAAVELLVLDGSTGRAVGGAAIGVTGELRLGDSYRGSADAGPAGTAAFVLPLGNFTANASAPGYATAQYAFDLNGSSVSVTLRLTPTAGPASSWLGSVGTPLLLLFLAAAAVTIVILRRRRRARPTEGEEGTVDPRGPVEPTDGADEMPPEAP